jgi:glycerol-3-phosphate acyltransferase PlsX
MIRIAVDAVGGDYGPGPILAGAVAAARELPIGLTLVGPEARVRAALGGVPGADAIDVQLVDSDEAVGMAERPVAGLRRRPQASIRVAVGELAAGRAAALFSAGNTGATVMAAYSGLGMLRGVDRPALAAAIPTRRHVAVLLDVGANVECRPSHLVQFAAMGTVFARVALGVERPRVALLSIGEEETKGNDLTREAHRALKASGLDFAGNLEARDVYAGGADVIVCDGFTGNIALKVSEGMVEMIAAILREGFDLVDPGRSIGTALPDAAGLRSDLSARFVEVFERRVHHDEYGAAPLLGVSGLALVGHGRSSARAVQSGIAMAYRFAASGFVARVQQGIISSGEADQ